MCCLPLTNSDSTKKCWRNVSLVAKFLISKTVLNCPQVHGNVSYFWRFVMFRYFVLLNGVKRKMFLLQIIPCLFAAELSSACSVSMCWFISFSALRKKIWKNCTELCNSGTRKSYVDADFAVTTIFLIFSMREGNFAILRNFQSWRRNCFVNWKKIENFYLRVGVKSQLLLSFQTEEGYDGISNHVWATKGVEECSEIKIWSVSIYRNLKFKKDVLEHFFAY